MKTYTILIVDDFFVERETAKEVLTQSNLPVMIVGEAENGLEALDFLVENPTDFILVDIEMPMMSGLDFMRTLKAQGISSEVVFFSLYNLFDYVHEALNMGAFGYILKPIQEEELINIFEKLIDKKVNDEEEKKKLTQLEHKLEEVKPLLIDRFIRSLLVNEEIDMEQLSEEMLFFGIRIGKEEPIAVVYLEIDDFELRTKGFNFALTELFLLKVEEGIRNHIQSVKGLYTRTSPGVWAMIIPLSTLEKSVQKDIWSFLGEFIEEMYEKERISFSASVSADNKPISALSEGYHAARKAMEYKFALGVRQIIDASEIHSGAKSLEIDFKRLLEETGKVIQSEDPGGIHCYVNAQLSSSWDFISKREIKKLAFSMLSALQLTINDLDLRVQEIFGDDVVLYERFSFDTLQQVREEMISIFGQVYNYLVEHSDGALLVVRRVKDFVKEHYSERITVKDISDAVFYSPNYLNSLFKKETGDTLLEYLTYVRIGKAKKLLKELDMKIYQVAEAVGYRQESYFRNIFKRQTGFTPKEFIKKAPK